MISAELNQHMPIRFSEESFFGAIVDASGRKYLSEFDSVLTKIRNPWDPSKVCVVAAGLSGAATKAAVIGLTNMAEQVLAGYNEQSGRLCGRPARPRHGRGREGRQRRDPLDTKDNSYNVMPRG